MTFTMKSTSSFVQVLERTERPEGVSDNTEYFRGQVRMEREARFDCTSGSRKNISLFPYLFSEFSMRIS
jgi:hypothetical protein